MRNLARRRIAATGLVWAALTASAFGQSKLDTGIERTLSESADVDAASLAGVVGARRIIIRAGAGAMRAGQVAERISSALGSEATVRPLGAGVYLAESRTGFGVERLSRLMSALGADARLYRDEPVKPGAVRQDDGPERGGGGWRPPG